MKKKLSYIMMSVLLLTSIFSSCKSPDATIETLSPSDSQTAIPIVNQSSPQETDEGADIPRFEIFETPNEITILEQRDDVYIDSAVPAIIPQTQVILWVSTDSEIPKIIPSFSYIDDFQIVQPSLQSASGISIITPTPMPELNLFPIATVAPFTIIEKESVFKPVSGALFIPNDSDKMRHFAFKIEGAPADEIVWQVSSVQFSDKKEGWQEPSGLLDSAMISADVGSFSIDFEEFINKKTDSGFSLGLTTTSFYVRAVAVDASDNVMGSPGVGIEMRFGEASLDISQISSGGELKKIAVLFDLLSARVQGEPYFNGEYPNNLTAYTEKAYDTSLNLPLHFRPSGFPQNTETMILQVAKAPFESSPENYLSPAGLVFERKLQKGNGTFENLEDIYYSIPINFNFFYENEPTLYYVRASAITQGSQPGTQKAYYSKTVTVLCSPTGESNFNYYTPPPVVKIDMELPESRLVEYQRVRWETPNWMYLYQVVRQPTYGEYYGSFAAMSVPNKDALMPDMKVGTIIDFTPSYREEDKSWLESAWDAVSSFFSDITGFAASLANWVSTAYSNLKSGVIAFVADNLPLVPDKYRDELKAAIEMMVDSGLASVGIPPSLPNFDELTSLGTDYLASVALESAGIPADEITKDMVKDLGSGIASGVTSSVSSGGSPNPLNWEFVRQNPGTMYRPAYILVEIENNSDKVSPTGEISCTVSKTLSQDQKNDPNISSVRAGFNNSLYYELFYPQSPIPVPSLQPGQSIEIPIILEEHTGHPYSFCPHVMTQNDFIKMSKYFGEWNYNISIQYDLPPISEIIAERNLPTGDVVYQYLASYDTIHFEREPWDSFPE